MRHETPILTPSTDRRRLGAVAFAGRPIGRGPIPWPARYLGGPQRAALLALDRLHRLLDDIADADLAADDRLSLLVAVRDDLLRLCEGGAAATGLARTIAPLMALQPPAEELEAMVDGRRMAVDGRMRAPTTADLRLYLRRRHGSLAFMVLHCLDLDAPALERVVLPLGEAVGLTEALLDLGRDAGQGRLLLSREALAEAGVPIGDPAAALRHPRVGQACRALARLADERFDAATGRLVGNHRRVWPLHYLMQSQRRLLHRVMRRGWQDVTRRPHLGAIESMMLVLRARYG
ncbi:MAG: squalene/phytoene synthase family protein [Alphaproteobacteria bacterium]|nr:squalene/phytoene synthase family protein [Alphaproteobacteria bacterium]